MHGSALSFCFANWFVLCKSCPLLLFSLKRVHFLCFLFRLYYNPKPCFHFLVSIWPLSVCLFFIGGILLWLCHFVVGGPILWSDTRMTVDVQFFAPPDITVMVDWDKTPSYLLFLQWWLCWSTWSTHGGPYCWPQSTKPGSFRPRSNCRGRAVSCSSRPRGDCRNDTVPPSCVLGPCGEWGCTVAPCTLRPCATPAHLPVPPPHVRPASRSIAHVSCHAARCGHAAPQCSSTVPNPSKCIWRWVLCKSSCIPFSYLSPTPLSSPSPQPTHPSVSLCRYHKTVFVSKMGCSS